jgi:hypothetical protein
MEDNESRETQTETAPESRGADRRSFMKTAVKTVVAGAAVAGVVGAVGKAEAAPSCSGPQPVPKAVVKAHIRFNNQAQIKRQDILAIINGIFDTSVCPTCGLGGYPGPWDPGTVLEITLGTAFLGGDQLSSVSFEQAGGGGF